MAVENETDRQAAAGGAGETAEQTTTAAPAATSSSLEPEHPDDVRALHRISVVLPVSLEMAKHIRRSMVTPPTPR